MNKNQVPLVHILTNPKARDRYSKHKIMQVPLTYLYRRGIYVPLGTIEKPANAWINEDNITVSSKQPPPNNHLIVDDRNIGILVVPDRNPKYQQSALDDYARRVIPNGVMLDRSMLVNGRVGRKNGLERIAVYLTKNKD